MSNEHVRVIVDKFRSDPSFSHLTSFNFLVVGRSGVGKSSTINSLFGRNVAKVGRWEAVTTTVGSYTLDLHGIECKIFDTPGLCDAPTDSSNDDRYLDLMQAKVPQIDCLLFMTPLDEERVRSDEFTAVEAISEKFGVDIWKHSVIVFTFADRITDKKEYDDAVTHRPRLLRQAIARTGKVSATIANKIPSVMVSNRQYKTLDGKEWLGELFTSIFTRISDKGAVPFFFSLIDRLDLGTNQSSNSLNTYNSGSSSSPHTFGGSRQGYNDPWANNYAHQATYPNNVFDTLTNTLQGDSYSQKHMNNTPDNMDYIDAPRIPLNASQASQIRERVSSDYGIISALTVAGSAIGAVFGPVGAVIGGAIGAAVGLINWLLGR